MQDKKQTATAPDNSTAQDITEEEPAQESDSEECQKAIETLRTSRAAWEKNPVLKAQIPAIDAKIKEIRDKQLECQDPITRLNKVVRALERNIQTAKGLETKMEAKQAEIAESRKQLVALGAKQQTIAGKIGELREVATKLRAEAFPSDVLAAAPAGSGTVALNPQQPPQDQLSMLIQAQSSILAPAISEGLAGLVASITMELATEAPQAVYAAAVGQLEALMQLHQAYLPPLVTQALHGARTWCVSRNRLHRRQAQARLQQRLFA